MVMCSKCEKEIDVHNDKWERETISWTIDGKPVIIAHHRDCAKTKALEFEFHRAGQCHSAQFTPLPVVSLEAI